MYSLPILKKISSTTYLHIICLSLMSFLCFPSWGFSLDDVAKKAEALSKKSYVAPIKNIPRELATLQFADYQKIRFNESKAFWIDLNTNFKLQFYHQGMYFDSAVKINEIVNNQIHEIKYSADYFDLSAVKSKNIETNKLGFAGFKVQFPINNKTNPNDEIFTALGASYFRVIGKNQVYGLSARGLAIDTGEMSGEEFPNFVEYWIERPEKHHRHLVIYALMDSPSVSGAYKLTLVPSIDATVKVEAKLFLRKDIKKLGIAPLTSMFLFGPNQPSTLLNYRPALHDSNGLSILTANNEWIWRPLNNPKKLTLSSYELDNPQGFGLIQRTKNFDDYLDLDDHYEKRPSAWIEVLNYWGKGRVELVEIPTLDETNDNIVSYWVPEKKYHAGEQLDFSYRIHYTLNEKQHYPKNIAIVNSTRLSLGDIKQANLIRKLDGSNAYVIDFISSKLSPDVPISIVSNITNGTVLEVSKQFNDVDNGWRVFIRFNVDNAKKPTDISIELVDEKTGTPISERWSGQYPVQ